MKSVFNLIAILLTGTTLLLADMGVAEAKRLGGGQSFGSKFSHSQSLKKDSADSGRVQRQAASPAQQKNAERKQQLAQRGGMMGMLGALAMGGLLGALFFGGAFESMNFMDLLVLGLIAFLLYKLMARRAQPAMAGAYGGPNQDDSLQRYEPAVDRGGSQDDDSEPASVDMLRAGAPKSFDRAGFIDGAKHCFARLQRAWDEGDLADIRQFTTDHVFGEIQEQYRASGSQAPTEIVSLDAELLSATDLGSRQEAIVLFRADLKEDGQQQQVEEVWHFVKPANSRQPTWFLDGIQQVEG